MSSAFNATAESHMTIEEPPKPNGCAKALAYIIVYGTVALGFWKFLELVTAPFL